MSTSVAREVEPPTSMASKAVIIPSYTRLPAPNLLDKNCFHNTTDFLRDIFRTGP
jgi:hypothetical protein